MITHHMQNHTEEELWRWSINLKKIKAVFNYTTKNGTSKKEPKPQKARNVKNNIKSKQNVPLDPRNMNSEEIL